MVSRFSLIFALAASLSAAPSAAQTGGGVGSRITYEASFFATFAPSSALDIIRRTPGFQLEDSDTDVRGFGQAAGNLVINGQRPSTKSDSLQSILSRIPASRVARVEVGAGDLFGAEFAGKAQVLNLVTIAATGIAGTIDAEVRRSYDGKVLPEGTLSALTKRGNSTFNASIDLDNDTTKEEGSDTFSSLPSGNLIEYRRKINAIKEPVGTVSGSWAYDAGSNRTAHLNGRASLGKFSLTQNNAVRPVTGPERNDFLTQRYEGRTFEVGGDVTRPLAGGGLKLVGLATRRKRDNDDLSLLRVQSVVTSGFAQTLDDSREETVGRLVWTRSNLYDWSVETGGEAALNRLESKVDLFSINAGGAQTRIDLPVDDSTVKEIRGEVFLNAGRPLTQQLRVDLGMTYESSRLTVRGDAQAERDLNFLRPKATLDWRQLNGWHVQLAVSRTVAQLQFEDFISAAELATERVNGGNANIVPQRAWEALLTVERPFFGNGLAKVEVGYNWISLVQDRVPTPEGFDAPGNLGDGRLFSLKGTLDAPLTRFGIKGGRLSGYASLVDTSVEDPYTLRNRGFSSTSRFAWEANFRQDLGTFAWGVSMNSNTKRPVYRLNEIDTLYVQDPYVSVFAEYRPSAKTIVTFGIDNLLDDGATRERVFYTPNRRTPQPNALEFRERNQHIIPYLNIKRNFG